MPQTGQQDDPTVVRSRKIHRRHRIVVFVAFVLGVLVGYGAHYLQTSPAAPAATEPRAN